MRKAPRRVLALDQKYSRQGGLANYLLGRVDAGARVPDLAAELTDKLGEYVSPSTVYGWIDRFRTEKGDLENANR